MIKPRITHTVALLFGLSVGLTAQTLTTYSFDAEINDSQIVNAELSSVLDQDLYTHIAWIRQIEDVRTLMYSFYNNETLRTYEIVSYPNGVPIAPKITVDFEGNPHIVFILKKDADGSTVVGNYAVMYAGGVTGEDSFVISQVSTNPTDTSDDTNSEFDSYVNGRPGVSILNNGDIIVHYLSDAYSGNGWDNFLIQATLNGDNWEREVLFNVDELVDGTYAVTEGFSAPVMIGNDRYVATIDIGDYRPQFFYEQNGSWTSTILEEFAGIFDNHDVHLYTDNEGNTHMMWFYEGSDSESFVYTKLQGSSYTKPIVTEVENTPAGNLFGYAIDRTQMDRYFFYGKSFSPDGYLIAFDQDSVAYEILLEDVGEVYGRRSLHADNGFISLVTASEDEGKIYITTGSVGLANSSETIALPNKLNLSQNYPNPFNPTTNIEFSLSSSSEVRMDVFSISGNKLAEITNKWYQAGVHTVQFDASNLASGMYIYRIQAGSYVQTRKMMLIK